MARLDHLAIQRFFPNAADGAARRPVARRRCAAAQAGRNRSRKTLFCLGAAASARQFGAVSAIRRSHRGAVRRLRSLRRLSDVRVAIYGPAALTALARRAGELHNALPKKSFYAVHAEPRLFFEPADFSVLIGDPGIIGLHISPKGRGSQPPVPGSLYAWAAERFGTP